MTSIPNYHALSTLCLVAFFALPIVILGIRATRPQLMPWWLAGVVVVILGWLLSVGIVEFHFAGLGADLRAYGEQPPSELLKQYVQDTGRPFARFFGWSYALIYFVPCIVLYAIFQIARRWCANRNA